ncbi:MAG: hypothetical protein HOV94_15525, partial [Saccharothrix sp.]|nr:hypothetical protein [Saccharothrix sp.]
MSRRQSLAVVLAVALAGVVPAAASAAARTAVPADVVPGSYIVVLKDAAQATVADRARTLASAHKGTVDRVYSSA